MEKAPWHAATNALFCSCIPHIFPLLFKPFDLRLFRISCVCVLGQNIHISDIFPSDVSSVSKTDLPSVSVRKYASFLVHSVKRHRKSVLYYTHKYIRMRIRGLIRDRCKIFLHRSQIGFGAHQTFYVTETTSLSPRSKAAGAWNRSFLSLSLRRYESVELYLHSPICLHGLHRGHFYFFLVE